MIYGLTKSRRIRNDKCDDASVKIDEVNGYKKRIAMKNGTGGGGRKKTDTQIDIQTVNKLACIENKEKMK